MIILCAIAFYVLYSFLCMIAIESVCPRVFIQNDLINRVVNTLIAILIIPAFPVLILNDYDWRISRDYFEQLGYECKQIPDSLVEIWKGDNDN